ncbi:LOW QUALITY PROTEIN: ovochymase-2-like [Paramacrobiotus metropolitanus]|uniref:LOW QUALITY PROTEIN: ovochymase-2-like n=1 Tax=Paramacrobiotus metropolitanus TaxID=2943436 RepID=UPI00244619D2|nr:LOW QUALITY PROTEIN: ovochymase-2-like [Paramacrobiotus metropolitanus]
MLCTVVISDYVAAETTHGCKSPAIINASSGSIESPYYDFYPNQTYPFNLRCRWIIQGTSGQNIKLTFGSGFSVGTNPTLTGRCGTDFVRALSPDLQTICNRNPLQVPLYGDLCGSEPPSHLVIGNDTVVIEFCTFGLNNFPSGKKGFHLHFNSTTEDATVSIQHPAPPTTPAPSECEDLTFELSDYNSTGLYIESPRFPNTYPENTNCVWKVNLDANEPRNVLVNAEFFELDKNDELTINQQNSIDFTFLTFKFLGKNGPQGIRLTGNFLFVTFDTDGVAGSGKGFRIHLKFSDCSSDTGICVNNPRGDVCFTEDMMCDGKRDCQNGEDENCPTGCGSPAFPPLLSTKQQRIVGGIEARPHSWPWHVAFRAFDGALACSGTIIDHSWILTSKDCCQTLSFANGVFYGKWSSYSCGEHDLFNTREPNVAIYYIDQLIEYPNVGGAAFFDESDFCLVKTKSKIFFNDHVMPVCLPSVIGHPAGTVCYATGWGAAEKNEASLSQGAYTDRLRQVDLTILSDKVCSQQFNTSGITPGVLSHPAAVCVESNSAKSTCYGDTGGPLVCRSSTNLQRWELVGVVNRWMGCVVETSGMPSYFSKVSYEYVLDWITSTVFPFGK